jgi:hypothetical protein
MEVAMPRIRIGAIAASFLVVVGVTVGSAAAQTATVGSTGKPLQLLAPQKSEAKPGLHARSTAKVANTTHLKRRIARHMPAKTRKTVVQVQPAAATAALPANIWPTAHAAAPGNMGTGGLAALAPQPAPASISTEPMVDTDPDEIVANGHTVQTASPEADDLSGLAGGHQQQAAETPGNSVAAKGAMLGDPDSSTPVVRAMVVKAVLEDPPSPVGSATWIAHVLAALGGALTAGVLAWFLIGSAPQRHYG